MQPPRRHATYYGAIALLDRLPARGCAANSATLYARVFRNMWSEPVLDALRPGDAQDTYGVRRASNAPGPRDLAEGFRQTVLPVLPAWALIAFLLLFGEPIVNWLTH
jgi:hypothetical protein